jgi:hypothetical protein
VTEDKKTIPSVSVSYARNGSSTKANSSNFSTPNFSTAKRNVA